jgi:hypothetical protein
VATLLLPAVIQGAAGALTTGGLSAAALASTSVSLTGLGSLLATSLGAILDSQFLMPRLFGKDATEGQRIGDLQIQETVEGAPENRVFGPRNRVAGAVVWMSDLREVRKEEGGKNGEFITYQYYAHVLIRVCRAKTPISRISKMWADGKVFYDAEQADISITSTAITSRVESQVFWFGGPAATNYKLLLDSDANASGPDFTPLRSGNKITVSGYAGGSLFTNLRLVATMNQGSFVMPLRAITSSVSLQVDDVIEIEGSDQSFSVETAVTVATSGTTNVTCRTQALRFITGSSAAIHPVSAKRGVRVNNGTFNLLSTATDPDPSGTHITTLTVVDPTNAYRKFVAQGTGTSLTVQQTNPTFKRSQVAQIHILNGGPDQAVPAILEQFEGSTAGVTGHVYAMRNRAGVLLEDVQLTDFGNRLPNFEELVEERTDPVAIADIIRTVLVEDADFPESAIDTSGVTGTVEGFAIRGPQPPKRSLQPLFVAFSIVAWERNGKVFFANLANLTPTMIDVAELGARDANEEPKGRPVSISDPPRDSLPSEVVVSYRSAEKDFQTATRRSARTESVPINIQQIELGSLLLDDDKAQQLADQLIARAWGAQRGLAITLPPSRAGTIHEGMLLTYGPVYGQTWTQFVERLDRGSNMVLSAQGQEFDAALLVQTQTAEGSLGFTAASAPVPLPAPVRLALMDLPALSDQHRKEPGVYVAAMSEDPSRAWRGASIFSSTDGGDNWSKLADAPAEAVMGELVTPPSVTVVAGMWDDANVIRIRIHHPTAQISSVTDDECLSGRNRFLIGREIIGSATVTFVSYDPTTRTKTFDLSRHLRGLLDTDQVMSGHLAGEEVVHLDGPGVVFVPLDFSDVDAPRAWKALAPGAFIDDGVVRSTPITARNARPYHVRDIVGTRDVSNNLTITWERTSRASRTFLDQGEPLDEELESYEIDVLDGSDVVRIISVLGTRTASYSAANQTADGLTPGDPVTIRIYQMSASFLRGQESEVTV